MMDYLPLFPIVLLLLAGAVLIMLRLIRPKFAYSWVVAAFSALLSWVVMLFSHSSLSQSISLFQWQPEWLFTYSPSLLNDPYSWGYAFSISTLLLSAILTDAARQEESNWFVWSSNLLLCGLGIAAVQSGNFLTLLMLWTAIDLVDVVVFLTRAANKQPVARAAIAFSSRTAGTLLVIWAILNSANAGVVLDYDLIPAHTSFLLLAAAFLRLGIIPLFGTFPPESPSRRSLGTVYRLTTAATGLILITRLAAVGDHGSGSSYLVLFTGLLALYAALLWVVSKNELDGQPYWIIGIAAFSIASAVRSQPDASLAWGVLAILAGGLLFLASTSHRYLLIILAIGFVGISTLPYTPAWNGMLLYSMDFTPLFVLFLIAQSIFMAGYLRFALLPAFTQSGLERWIWVIYPWGMIIIPVSQYIIGWQTWSVDISVSTVLPGLLVSLFAGIWLVLGYRLRKVPRGLIYAKRILYSLNNVSATGWIYPLLGRVFLYIGRSITFVVAVLEGDGGVLWALFFLVLFIAILAQVRLGV